MAVTNTGIVLRTITGVNESDLFLDSESTSVATNTGVVERSIVGVHDANFVHPIGDEEVVNGSFDDSSSWGLSGGVSIGGGKVNFDIVSGGFTRISQNISLVDGKIYRVKLDLTTEDVGKQASIRDTSSGDSGGLQQVIDFVSGTTSYTYSFTANSSSDAIYIKRFTASGDYSFSIDNVSVKEMLVNRESTATNTGIVERAITGLNESELWLDAESTSVVNNTGIVERPITGVNESDALFPDNTDSTVVNISDTIIPLLTALEARATTFENREGTQNILINLQKC